MTSCLAGYNPEYAGCAFRLARLGLTEEAIAHCLDVPVYTLILWQGAVPELARALEQGWAFAASRPSPPPSRSKYPAYTYALRFAARTKRPELAAALRARMSQMRAAGPAAMSAFNDAIWIDLMLVQPGCRIPRRAS